MSEGTTIGLDLAKNVFRAHGVDASGQTVIRRQLKRSQVVPFFKPPPPCLVGMAAWASARHWAREISALGHQVRLMPARYVKAYVKRNKNDAADAEAIRAAVTRPTMRFVEIKTREQQSVPMVHRTRKLFVRQHTMLIDAIRAHPAEFGIVAGVGRNGVERLLRLIDKSNDERVPPRALSPAAIKEGRINRPDTWQHRPALHHRSNIPCQQGAVHTWLIREVPAMHATRPVYPQQATLYGRCPLSC